MRGGPGVLGRVAVGAGERRREPLVERLDRDAHDGAERLEEALRLLRLGPTPMRSGSSERTSSARRASPGSVPTRSTTQSGRASVPVGSETATPVRAAP